ncbi:hypothetical protein KY386_03785 [Candidatus Parcubacteria bacterium]|nr:hypothetical protein [Candidatus Parcubacteria bacterium]
MKTGYSLFVCITLSGSAAAYGLFGRLAGEGSDVWQHAYYLAVILAILAVAFAVLILADAVLETKGDIKGHQDTASSQPHQGESTTGR